ncbi:Putative transposase of IS4/5 family [Streptomyces sp. Ncost-T10-10d]|nr:Putative transposase of IS4/5 family [Streptomyces sp. Ncost-T10-10d]
MSDELWDRLEPLLPQRHWRFRYPDRKPLPDREVLCEIRYMLHTGPASAGVQPMDLPRTAVSRGVMTP